MGAVGPEPVFCNISPVPLFCWVPRRPNDIQVVFPSLPDQLASSWTHFAGGIDGGGREKGREKPCFSPSPSGSWVVSPVVAASLPGLWILLDSCAVIPAPV